ncbi:hypothetical protein V494_00526 [Pseudogymnoascus sp. VKM F-4513 (FW-928)]|nr:hypothetical protein V494_00526 [Pseudogymnoascus sp. VKM F-4513 (FW-928)]
MGENSPRNPAENAGHRTRRCVSQDARGTRGHTHAHHDREIDGDVDAATAAPLGAAGGVDEEDEEDAQEGEADEDENCGGPRGAVAGE